jgi:DNA-binding response OmpR family regulator
MPPIEVALVHWPRDRDERDRLAAAMLPRLLLVPEEERPPATSDLMEDWIRLPADERDVSARLHTLSERAAGSLDQTVLVDGRCLRRSSVTVPLGPSEATFARLLVAASGQVVPRDRLIEAIWPDGPSRSRALDDVAYRLRKRIHVVGLDVVNVRARGFALHMLSPVDVTRGER